MVKDGALDPDAGITGKTRAFTDGVVLRRRNKADIAHLNQIIDLDNRGNAAMHMPGDLPDKGEMLCHKLLNILRLFDVTRRPHYFSVLSASPEKKRMPSGLFTGDLMTFAAMR